MLQINAIPGSITSIEDAVKWVDNNIGSIKRFVSKYRHNATYNFDDYKQDAYVCAIESLSNNHSGIDSFALGFYSIFNCRIKNILYGSVFAISVDLECGFLKSPSCPGLSGDDLRKRLNEEEFEEKHIKMALDSMTCAQRQVWRQLLKKNESCLKSIGASLGKSRQAVYKLKTRGLCKASSIHTTDSTFDHFSS